MPTFIESLVSKLKGKVVEIYLGDNHEVIHTTDSDKSVNSILLGKIIDGEGDCLEFQVYIFDVVNQYITPAQTILINGYGIKTVTPATNFNIFSPKSALKKL